MTSQVAEILHHKGQELNLAGEPLNLFLTNSIWKPSFTSLSTACWRGYIGEWAIDHGRLYLEAVYDSDRERSFNLSEIFAGSKGRVFAHWVTGEYRCPIGKLLDYVHMGYASCHERDLFLSFKQGELVSERIVENGCSNDPDTPGRYGPGAWVRLGSPEGKHSE
jgi:hypothetical protein